MSGALTGIAPAPLARRGTVNDEEHIVNMTKYNADTFAPAPELNGDIFKPENLLSNPISDRHFSHAAFVVGCLVQQGIIQLHPDEDGMTRFMDGILIVARCLEMLPDNGDWPQLPFDTSLHTSKG